ncbi:MAG: TIM barrel protein [Chloroflexi bacterium]|nr:TIM barrel protein [Chloroflexota bacterium]
MRYGVNLNTVWAGMPLDEQVARIVRAGFDVVEFWFACRMDMPRLMDLQQRFGFEVGLFNLDPDPVTGTGYLGEPDGEQRFFETLRDGLRLAPRLGTRKIHVMVGRRAEHLERSAQREIIVERLRRGADEAAAAGVRLLLEPLNRFDRPEYFLNHSAEAMSIIDEVDSPWVWLQYDFYHMQMMEGNLINTMRALLPRIGHLQLADAPGRIKPGLGEINIRNVLGAVRAAGYDGVVGLEYDAAATDPDPFDWLAAADPAWSPAGRTRAT